MQLLQGQVLQQRARLPIGTGLSHQLRDALSQGRALVGLGCLKHLLQHPHALGPCGILHIHPHMVEHHRSWRHPQTTLAASWILDHYIMLQTNEGDWESHEPQHTACPIKRHTDKGQGLTDGTQQSREYDARSQTFAAHCQALDH